MKSVFRDENVRVGTPQERRKILKEIIDAERRELGIPPVAPEVVEARRKSQLAHIARISRPLTVPTKRHDKFLRAPRSLRGKGLRSPDDLFAPAEGEEGADFWLYDSQKVTQSTLGSLANQNNISPAEIRRSPVCLAVKKKVDALVAQAATKLRCGIVFDIVSTSKIINSGIPHEIGNFIYDYIETAHYDKTSIKFTFVGITDNVNCCAARDVFCRDELLGGRYIGDTKRTFDALDNVHMFTVFPGRTSLKLHGISNDSGSSELPPVPTRASTAMSGTRQPSRKRSPSAKTGTLSPARSAASAGALDDFDGSAAAFLTEVRARSNMR